MTDTPANFRELIGPHASADILSLLNGALVRHLSWHGDMVLIDPQGGYEPIIIAPDTRLFLIPCPEDRGIIAFTYPGVMPYGQLCCEFDTVRYPGGTMLQIAGAGLERKAA